LRVEEIGPAHADEFVRVYETVWGGGGSIRPLVGQSQFRCYLAYVDGQAAALGVLHISGAIGSMANGLTAPQFRDRGCHIALLHHRSRDAAADGCEWLVSQCMPGSISQRNQLRAGFRVAGTKAWWVPLPALRP
jgi:hypothetical protein